MSREKVKVKVSVSRNTTVLFIVLAAAAVAGVVGYNYYVNYQAPVYSATFNGLEVQFRADLREAQRVPVDPDEATLYGQMVKPPKVENNGTVSFRAPLRNVTIVFKQVDSKTMGWYTVEASEIIKKMALLYKGKYGIDLNFAVKEVDSYDGLRSGNLAPIVALVHPDIAESTGVSVDRENNVVSIHGGDSLRDFDLATVKFMMVVLNVTE